MKLNFHEICKQYNLDPKTTSLHKAGCIFHGLDPDKTSIHALDCVSHGLDPNTTSINDLKKAKGESN